jgi:hypothetical protein
VEQGLERGWTGRRESQSARIDTATRHHHTIRTPTRDHSQNNTSDTQHTSKNQDTPHDSRSANLLAISPYSALELAIPFHWANCPHPISPRRGRVYIAERMTAGTGESGISDRRKGRGKGEQIGCCGIVLVQKWIFQLMHQTRPTSGCGKFMEADVAPSSLHSSSCIAEL